MVMKRSVVWLALVVVGLMLVACASLPSAVMDEPVPAGAEGAQVVELQFTPTGIKPDRVTIKAGQKVLFVIKNTDTKESHSGAREQSTQWIW